MNIKDGEQEQKRGNSTKEIQFRYQEIHNIAIIQFMEKALKYWQHDQDLGVAINNMDLANDKIYIIWHYHYR